MWISDQWTVTVSVLVITSDIAMTIFHISVMSERKQQPQKIKTGEESKKTDKTFIQNDRLESQRFYLLTL